MSITDDMKQNILGLTIGKIYVLGDIWDGDGDAPAESYSYYLKQDLKHSDYGLETDQWVDYQFEFLKAEDKENIETGVINGREALDIPVKLTNIEIL